MSIVVNKVSRNICQILINRPSKKNALDLATVRLLKDAFQEFEENLEYRVAILGGIGGNFCAGYDLNDIVDEESAMPKIHQIEQMLWPLGTRLSDKKIVIAAMDGYTAGFGYELALKCQLRVVERDARLGFMNRRFGMPIMNGGTVLLPRLIGLSGAMELIATGKAQLAPESLQVGLVHYIADFGCALGRATTLARCLEKFHQPSLIHDLKSTYTFCESNQNELLRLERERSLEYLKNCGPLLLASKFLKGELCRHGSYDLGNIIGSEPEVTL